MDPETLVLRWEDIHSKMPLSMKYEISRHVGFSIIGRLKNFNSTINKPNKQYRAQHLLGDTATLLTDDLEFTALVGK